MKRNRVITMIILSLMMCLVLGGCGTAGNGSQTGKEETQTQADSQNNTETENVNTAVPDETGSGQDKADVKDGSSFDLEAGTVMLNSGYEMPILGIGMFRLSQSEAETLFIGRCVTDTVSLIRQGFMETRKVFPSKNESSATATACARSLSIRLNAKTCLSKT